MSKRIRHELSIAVFMILRRASTVCLLRRGNTGWMDGCFSLPAGTLEPNETIREAAIREAREEVGVAVAHLRHVHALHSRTEGRGWVGHFFVATDWTGEPGLCEPHKHSELRWASLSRLPDDVIPYVRQALMHVERQEPYSEYGWPQR